MQAVKASVSACILVGLLAGAASATVNIETVPVGNPGNSGELSGTSAGGAGPDRICGSVGYSYNIGKYEVTAGQYCEFLNAVAVTDTYGLYNPNMWSWSQGCKIQRSGSAGTYAYTVAPEWANRPVDWVSFWDACRFANWMQNGQPMGDQGVGTTETGTYTLNGYTGSYGQTITRNAGCKWAVPSEDEWYKAAYHKNDGATGNYWDYPTSSNTAPGRDLDDVSGNNANYWGTPYPIQSPYYATVAGEFQNSDSPYGTFDQGGNVLEWNDSVLSDRTRVVRGGGFPSSDNALRAASRYSTYPGGETYEAGFRVVALPEPATLAFFALGAVGLLRKRRTWAE